MRDELVAAAHRLAARGLSPGSSGNLSVRLDDDRLLVTPTGIGLADLTPDDLAEVPSESGPRPSKELPLHRAVHEQRPDARAVVHLHAPYSTALSCLPPDTWPGGRLPLLTPYQVTKVGELPFVPYAVPGSDELAAGVADRIVSSPCLLLANHGSLATAPTLTAAVEAAEEIEAAAHLMLTLRGLPHTTLTAAQVTDLRSRLKG